MATSTQEHPKIFVKHFSPIDSILRFATTTENNLPQTLVATLGGFVDKDTVGVPENVIPQEKSEEFYRKCSLGDMALLASVLNDFENLDEFKKVAYSKFSPHIQGTPLTLDDVANFDHEEEQTPEVIELRNKQLTLFNAYAMLHTSFFVTRGCKVPPLVYLHSHSNLLRKMVMGSNPGDIHNFAKSEPPILINGQLYYAIFISDFFAMIRAAVQIVNKLVSYNGDDIV